MKKCEFTDSHDNNVRVQESSTTHDGEKKIWLFLDGKRYENGESKPVSVASCLTVSQAKILMAGLQDMVDSAEGRR